MSLSKVQQHKSNFLLPFVVKIVGKYFEQLYTHPIRTKSLTSCAVLSLGNITSQLLYNNDNKINKNNLKAFALFGFIFGGSVPHTFHSILQNILPGERLSDAVLRFLLERFTFTPFFQLLSLYSFAIFEGRSHEEACRNLSQSYLKILKDNWKYLSLFQFINVAFVPPILRVLFGNLIGFFWCIYVARKRKLLADRSAGNRP